MATLPIALVCFLRFGPWRARLLVFGCIVAGIACSRAFVLVLRHSGGFDLLGLAIDFAKFDDLGAHIAFALHAFLALMSADFTNKPPASVVMQVLRLPFVLALGAALVEMGWKFVRTLRAWPLQTDDEDDVTFLDETLFASVMLGSAAAIVTTAISDPYHVRYFLPSVVAGSILVARRFAHLPLFSLYAKIAFAASALVVAMEIKNGPSKPLPADPSILALRDTLKSLDLRHGYGGYWQSSILTALTEHDIQVLAVVQTADKVEPFRWFTNLDWYRNAAMWNGRVFVVAKEVPDMPFDLAQDRVVATFGAPDKIVRSGPFSVDIYERAKLPYSPLP
jgi:hypothetical protein